MAQKLELRDVIMSPNAGIQKQNETIKIKANIPTVPQTLCLNDCMKTNSYNNPIHSFINSYLVITVINAEAVKEKLLSSFTEKFDSPHHAFSWAAWSHSTLEILIALLAKKANHNPRTSFFLVSALNSLEPTVNSAEFYWSPQKCSKGTFFMCLGTGIQMKE